MLMFPSDTLPFGWLSCDGREVLQSEYPTLFARIGATYGNALPGHFRLPDLRGRTPVGTGQGEELSNRTLGEYGGEETHTITIEEMPAHTHLLQCSNAPGSSGSPAGQYPAASKLDGQSGQPVNSLYAPTAGATMHESAITTTGQNAAHNNMQPFLVLHFIIKVV